MTNRQYYIYVTDPNCKRLGTQCWVYCAIMVSEAMLCIKNARELFERTQAVNIVLWLLIQLIISIVFVYGCILYHRYTQVINNIVTPFFESFPVLLTPFFIFSFQEEPNEDEEVLVSDETQKGTI